MFKLRIRFLEPFKDGQILEGRQFKVDEVTELDQMDVEKIVNSGGEVEVLETLVPNPLKKTEEEKAAKEVKTAQKKRSVTARGKHGK